MFDSPQVKWDLIFSRINFEYELSHELPNNWRYSILGKKSSAQSPFQK